MPKTEEPKEEEKEEEKPKEPFNLVEVPTQTGIFVRDESSGEVLDDKAVLLTILNKLSRIEETLLK